MTLAEIDTFLSAEASARKPLNWAGMSSDEKEAFSTNFPNRSFSDEQRAVLRKYFIKVPNATALEGMNESLPADRRLSPVTTTAGDTVLPLDLWTDADTWGGAMNALRGMKVLELTQSDFPQEELA